jgi:hypothetical protein
MAGTVTQLSRDGNWQAELGAFNINLFFYKAIGATLRVRHKEMKRNFFWESYWLDWVEKPVPSLSVTDTFRGLLANLSPAAASRSERASNASACDCRLWSVGIGISMDASANTGLPNPDTASPSGASLEVRSVSATGQAILPNGELISVGPATAP